MSENKAASRYAKSLIDLSIENNALEKMKDDMVLVEQVIRTNPELGAILNNPIVPLEKKGGILRDVFNSKVSEITNTYLKLLVSKGRSSILFGTAKEFINQYNSLKGIVTAEITSATSLTDANRVEVVGLVKKETGANQVVLKEKINEKLIGGFILKVGDRQFDASISSSLNKLKKEFSQGIA